MTLKARAYLLEKKIFEEKMRKIREKFGLRKFGEEKEYQNNGVWFD
jgi:hypothetical protein